VGVTRHAGEWTNLDEGTGPSVETEGDVERPRTRRDLREVLAVVYNSHVVEVDPDEHHMQRLECAAAASVYEKQHNMRVDVQDGADQKTQAKTVALRAGRVHVRLHAGTAPEHGREEHAELDRAECEPNRERRHGRGPRQWRGASVGAAAPRALHVSTPAHVAQ
jgi:hypothetical protein